MDRKFWIVALISLINALSFTILIPIIYLYGKEFGLNDFQTSLLFFIYSLAQFFATPVIGKLSDRFGRKPLLIISLLGTVIANFLAGTAPTVFLLFLARFLDGITGGNISVVQAVIADVTTGENRAKAFGINGAAFGLGFVLGPAFSLLAQKISLGASFLGSSAIAFIALILTIFLLPETLKHKTNDSLHIFDLGLDKLFKGFLIPRIGILLMVNFLIGTTFTMFTFAFQPYFIKVLHQTSQSLTLMFLMFGVMGILMQTKGLGLLSLKFTLVQILWISIFVRSLSFILMPIWANIIYFVIIAMGFSVFNSLVQPTINALISLNTKPQEQGMALGLNASYLSAANAFGPVIAGLLIHQANPATYAYPLYIAGIFTFFVLGIAIANRQQYSHPI